MEYMLLPKVGSTLWTLTIREIILYIETVCLSRKQRKSQSEINKSHGTTIKTITVHRIPIFVNVRNPMGKKMQLKEKINIDGFTDR